MRPTDLANGVGQSFVNEGNGRINARGVGLYRTCPTGFPLDRPRFELVSESRRVRSQHNTNTQINRRTDLLCHRHGVGVGCAMTCFVGGWRGKIWAMHEHQIGASSTSEIMCCIQTTAVTTQVEMVVRHRALVGGHPQAPLTKAWRLSICVRQWTAAIATMFG